MKTVLSWLRGEDGGQENQHGVTARDLVSRSSPLRPVAVCRLSFITEITRTSQNAWHYRCAFKSSGVPTLGPKDQRPEDTLVPFTALCHQLTLPYGHCKILLGLPLNLCVSVTVIWPECYSRNQIVKVPLVCSSPSLPG